MNATGCTCPLPRMSGGTFKHAPGCPTLGVNPKRSEPGYNETQARIEAINAMPDAWTSNPEDRGVCNDCVHIAGVHCARKIRREMRQIKKAQGDTAARYRFSVCATCGGYLGADAHPSWPKCSC